LYSADDIIKVTLSHGQTAKITGLPVGSYRIVEAVDATAYATTSTGEEGTIEAGVTAAAAFTNQYQRHRGDLVIEKVVRKEYADDAWNSDTFTFVIEGTALLADGEYTILVNGVEEQIQVQDQKVHMEKSILVAEAELGKTVSLILADLPVGTYTVTETKMEAYLTTVPDEAGNQVEENRITVTVAGEEAAAAARFLNTYKRTEGNLTICKEIQIAEGSTEVIRQEDVFTFMVQMPDGTKFAGCKYQTAGLEGITEVEVNAEGKLTVQLKHGQSVTISGLPVGSYVVSEAQLYDYGIDMGSGAASMEVNVKTNETTKVNCVNTYPIHRGTLTITKQNAADPEQVFIYEVTNSKGEVITVTVVGNGSTTIYDVPFDTYTVKQVSDWSWRYADTQQSVEIQDNAEYTVVFDDVIQDVQWLDDNSPMIRNRKKEEEDTAG